MTDIHDAGFVIDNPMPAGENWFEVTDPYVAYAATAIGPKRAMSKAEANLKRREARQKEERSPYLQVSLQHEKTYRKKLKEVFQ